MPPKPLVHLFLSALTGLFLALPAQADETGAGRLRVVTDDNYPPYLFRNEDGSVAGYLVDYWKLWEKKTGVPVELVATDWAEAQRRILAGEAEVIDMIYRTPKREPFYEFSAPYADLPVGIYSHASITGITDPDSLKGFQVGVQAGDACIEELQHHGIVSQVQYPNYASLIDAARRQEIKIFCLDEHPANFYLYKLKVESEFRKSFTLYTGHFHRATRKGHLATLELVEQGMQAISEGEQRQLQEKWFGTPVQLGHYARHFAELLLVLVAVGSLLFAWNLMLRRRVATRTADLQSTLEILQQATASEAEARSRLSATLQAIPDLLFEFDADHRYVDIFSNASSLLYIPRDELLGRPVSDVLPADAAGIVSAAIDSALASGHDYGRTVELLIGDETRWFELSVSRKGAGATASVLMLSRDVTARRQAEQELLLAREANLQAEHDRQFKALFDAMPVAVSYVEGKRIVFLNRQFNRLFGYHHNEMSSLDDWWQQAYPDPVYRAEVQATWADVIAEAERRDGQIAAREYRVTGKDGEVHDLLIGGQLLSAGLIATFTDISPLKHVEAELRQARDEARAASEAKSAFLANMSHEIRTPLNAIIGLSAMLARSLTDPGARERSSKIQASGQHLLGIINAILDLSKIEAGKFTLDEMPLRLETVVANVISMLTDRAREKNLDLRCELPPVLPTRLLGDPIRLQQALVNYAANAVKFTEHGTVTLGVEVLDEDDSRACLRLSVSDTGPGIAADTLERLFSAFEQGDNSTARRHGGTGLGLAITRRIAELMGGEAGARSTPGQGSTFWFSVCLKKGEAQAVLTTASQDESADRALRRRYAGLHVLVAEDEPINREITAVMLEEVGLRVDFAEDGEQAVTQAGRQAYPLILMDMQMPNLDGLDATHAIRQMPGYEHIPILALTANAFTEDRQRCLQAGMSGFIPKPVAPEELYRILLDTLDRYSRSPE